MLSDVVNIVGAAGNVITALALSIGGIWAYLQYKRRKEDIWNLEVTLEIEHTQRLSDRWCLFGSIRMKNVGARRVYPSEDGLILRLWKRKGDDGRSWEPIEIENGDLTRTYLSIDEELHGNSKFRSPEDYYALDPGGTYFERFYIEIKHKGMYRLLCRFHIHDRIGGGQMTDMRYFWLDS